MTTPLPLPDDPRIPALIEAWPDRSRYRLAGLAPYPPWLTRSKWLIEFEDVLREHYPRASSRELSLTARLAAPFPLAKPGVP